MRTISLYQPWASLWCSPAKVHETRHWSTDYRGWLAVHAAKKKVTIDDESELDKISRRLFGSAWRERLPRGAVIGAVDLIDCLPTEKLVQESRLVAREHWDDYCCGDFSEGRYAWRRGGFVRLPVPILCTGRQGFFQFDCEAFETFVRSHAQTSAA